MSPSEIRACARASLKGNWPTAALVTLVAGLLGGSIASGSPASGAPDIHLNFDLSGVTVTPLSPQIAGLLDSLLGVALSSAVVVGFAVLAVQLILGGALHVGHCRYHLNLADRRDARFSNLFSAVDIFGSALCMGLLRSLIVLLGMICLLIPGIIAGLGLCFAGFILADDPGCGAVEALKRSWAMTNGHKMDLFLLQLTFLGWYLLAAFTGGVGFLFVFPYQNAALAAVYRRMRPARSGPADL